jgi:transcriptional regulator with XRE-family HTH domain
MQFGERLKELREAAGLSQPALAEKCSLSVWTLRGWEQGRRHPSWRGLLDLAAALGVPAEAFAKCEGVPDSEDSMKPERPPAKPGRPRKAEEPAAEAPKKRTRKKKGE